MGQMATPKRVALLVNENAFGVKPDDPDRLIRLCRGVGIDVTAVERPASAAAMAQAAAAHADSVSGLLVVGGDGALNASLPGAMHRSVAVGMLPRGTVNVWAREIGLPVRPEAAIRALAEGSVESMDVGRIHWPENGESAHFLLMAGLGFDGEVTRLVNRRMKRFVGFGAYVVASIAAYFRHEPYEATVDVDGRLHRLRLTQLVAANCRRYGGDLPLVASAEPADGWLDLWTLGPAPKLVHAARFGKIVLRGADQGDRLLPRRARFVRVTAEHPVAVQLDGDPAPPLPGPIELSVIPGALQAWLPRRGY
jgi:diacylglycerol kinase family enzyme